MKSTGTLFVFKKFTASKEKEKCIILLRIDDDRVLCVHDDFPEERIGLKCLGKIENVEEWDMSLFSALF